MKKARKAVREDDLIRRIQRRLPARRGPLLREGIGDDAAILHPSPGLEWVVTCDQFIEGVHFLGGQSMARAAGYKSLARATSDIAAMGAKPRLFFLCLCLPADRTGSWLDEMLAGMARAAREFGLTLAGGDTARPGRADAGVSLSITVLGEVNPGRALRRDGARPGDAIYVSGQLGAAQLGLDLAMRRKIRSGKTSKLAAAHFYPPHFYPKIQIELGEWLANNRLASAAMDVSDGLSTDLNRLCLASKVGARIYQDRLPCVAVPPELASELDAQTLALHGGEDYGLLFTVPKRLIRRIPGTVAGSRVTAVGEIVAGRGIKLTDSRGREVNLAPGGWDHFFL